MNRGKQQKLQIPPPSSDEVRYLVEAKLLGQDTTIHSKAALVAHFPVEAGFFNSEEKVIPDCPVKKTIFGIQKSSSDENEFERQLNTYLKELPALPASIVKSEIVKHFFKMRPRDREHDQQGQVKGHGNKKKGAIEITENSTISGPLRLTSYYVVAPYSDPKTKFNLLLGSTVQVVQKEPTGWWMIDAGSGSIGWVPASYLAPVEVGNKQEVLENETLVGPEEVGARYISTSDYKATRDDEHSFVTGAVVKLVKKHVDGWWVVRYDGKEGLVPGALFRKCGTRQRTTYVKQIARQYSTRQSRNGPAKRANWHKEKSSAAGPSLVLYEAIADYEGEPGRDQTTLTAGSRVKVLDKKEHGWWYVEDSHGRGGWAPATYLKPILDPDCDSMRTKHKDTHFLVITAYKSMKPDELTISQGDKVTIIEASHSGWWKVRLDSKTQEGLVPSVCLKPYSEETASQLDAGSGLGTPAQLHLPGASDQLSSVEEEEEMEFDEEEEGVGAEDGIVMEGCYMAVAMDFKARRSDEMDVKEGDVVCVLDDSQEDTWYVGLGEKEGWLPVSILVPINEKLESAADDSLQLREQLLSMEARVIGIVSPSPEISRGIVSERVRIGTPL
eukprot:Em0015g973a